LNWWYLRQKRLILSVSNAIVPLLSTFFPCGFIVVVFVFCREKLGNATIAQQTQLLTEFNLPG
jgi:hypothetical protein